MGAGRAAAGIVAVLVVAAAARASAGGDPPIVAVEHEAPEMVVVPAGTFSMGFPDTQEEREHLEKACLDQFGKRFADICDERRWADASPPREVLLPAYAIDRHEVTVAEYRVCARAGACDVGPLLAGDRRYLRAAWPMVNVTWQDAVDFCAWEDKRLPTEAEWEKAARGTDARRWPWGDHPREDGANSGRVEDVAMSLTHGVVGGSYGRPLLEFVADDSDGADRAVAPGAMRWSESPYGVYDMAGNVSEWVRDYYHAEGYEDLPLTSPVRLTPEGGMTVRVVRGGSWHTPPLHARTYYRNFASPDSRTYDRGFRCARDL